MRKLPSRTQDFADEKTMSQNQRAKYFDFSSSCCLRLVIITCCFTPSAGKPVISVPPSSTNIHSHIVQLGDPLRLKCTTHLPGVLHWTRGTVNSSMVEFEITNLSENESIIEKWKTTVFDEGMYTCHAGHDAFEVFITIAAVTVEMSLSAKQRKALLLCHVQYTHREHIGLPILHPRWTNSRNEYVTNSQKHTIFMESSMHPKSTQLLLNNIDVEDIGSTYTCHIESESTTPDTPRLIASKTITVKFDESKLPPIPTTAEAKVMVGSTLELTRSMSNAAIKQACSHPLLTLTFIIVMSVHFVR